MKEVKITASKIAGLLAVKHREDVFIPECKNGPTHTANHLRMDAWVMKKSWVSPLTTGYEIKVSRSDFLNDHKWQRYLDYCNEFYFVCPTGLIDPLELPPEAGLMYVTKTGTRLFKKKAAPRRSVETPEALYKYIVMCRSNINSETRKDGGDQVDYWIQWLKDKENSTDIGYSVSRKIGDIVRETKTENAVLKGRMVSYDEFKKRLEELGFDISKHINTWAFDRKIDELIGAIPHSLKQNIRRTIDELTNLSSSIDEKH
jgi:hypothetical protein